MGWESASHFTDKYFVTGEWTLNVVSRFPKCEFLAADTETKLYLEKELLTEDRAYKLYKTKGQQWVRENVEVRAYAYMLSDGENFALFMNAEDFLTACSMFQVKRVFWYNAKFDFALFDYFFLTNDWQEIEARKEANEQKYRKMPDKTYQSMNGDFGQRYQMRIWKAYKNTRGQMKVHNFKMIDVCNIFGGGLRQNLEDFDIVDRHGVKVRKLEMDYVNADIEADIQYMINDTKGLYLLAEKIDKTIYDLTEFSLFRGDYLTAGGLAKRTMLRDMFGKSKQQNVNLLHTFFPITIEEDKDFRKYGLYTGGLCLVNPYKKNIVQKQVYKYDVNSMYPFQMRNMKYPIGRYRIVKEKAIRSDCVYIYKICRLKGTLKENMIPVWHDNITGDYVSDIYEPEERYIWKDELDEYKKWYNLSYEVIYILEFDAKRPKGIVTYVDRFYKIKKESKGCIRAGAKLFLNSAYGKWAQRPEVVQCHYVLDTKGYVKLEIDGSEDDEDGIMSVIVGSRITALARCTLLDYIQKICQGNVKDNFIYCDTDSVHSLTEYTECDGKELGKMKCEGIYEYAIYLAPKSYLMYNELTGCEPAGHYEVHCKGVNTGVVKRSLEGITDFTQAIKVFRPNKLFKCLAGLNVRGGKALIYVDKMIVNDRNFKGFKKQEQGLDDLDEDSL